MGKVAERRAKRGVEQPQFKTMQVETIELRYYTKKRAKSEVVYACSNDHKCSLRGCKFNLDIPDAKIVTIPFDYTKKWSYIKDYPIRYHIEYDFVNKTFKQCLNLKDGSRANYINMTNLNEQMLFTIWLPRDDL